MTYASTRNPERKIKLLRQVGNEVIAREVSTGEEITLTRNTLNRWWKRVEDVAEAPKKTEEPKSEATKETKSLVKALVKKEKSKPKEGKNIKSTEGKTMSVDMDNLAEFTKKFKPFCDKEDISLKIYDKVKNTLFFKANNRGIVRVYLGHKRCKVDTKVEFVPESISVRPQKHYFDASLYCSSAEVEGIVLQLLKYYKEEVCGSK